MIGGHHWTLDGVAALVIKKHDLEAGLLIIGSWWCACLCLMCCLPRYLRDLVIYAVHGSFYRKVPSLNSVFYALILSLTHLSCFLCFCYLFLEVKSYFYRLVLNALC